jgi:5-methylcytosine-specific restriction endonuclease McrA
VRVLRLDKTGSPIDWITKEEAATLWVKEQVVWSLGDEAVRLHGGINRNGLQSVLVIPAIVACKGSVYQKRLYPPLTNKTLFRRDDNFCMYCGEQYTDRLLTCDHVKPISLGGINRWNNVVAACQYCNNKKGGRTPEQAGMALLAIPFTPNMYEFMYLSNRQIISDQMDYLRTRFKGNARAWQAA